MIVLCLNLFQCAGKNNKSRGSFFIYNFDQRLIGRIRWKLSWLFPAIDVYYVGALLRSDGTDLSNGGRSTPRR